MKSQLLEDIGENHSLPIDILENTAAAPTKDKWRAGPWRQRETAAAEPCAAPAFAEPLAAPAIAEPLAVPAFAKPLAAPGFAEPLAVPAFAEPPPPRPPPPKPPLPTFDPDPLAESWAIANPGAEPTWFERWGRRAAAWSAGVAALVLVAGGAVWVYEETTTDQALAVASAALDTPVPARVVRAPVEPIDVQASELGPLAMDFQAEIPGFLPTPVAKKPVRSRVRTAAKAPPRRATPPPAPDPAAARKSQLAETLRQCRAAGYHAEQCVKRGCVATPYGIACKG